MYIYWGGIEGGGIGGVGGTMYRGIYWFVEIGLNYCCYSNCYKEVFPPCRKCLRPLLSAPSDRSHDPGRKGPRYSAE